MKKADLILALSEESGLSRADVARVLDALPGVVFDALQAGDEVSLPRLGVLRTQIRAARMGRNPGTGEALPLPQKTIPVFRAAKALKDAVAS